MANIIYPRNLELLFSSSSLPHPGSRWILFHLSPAGSLLASLSALSWSGPSTAHLDYGARAFWPSASWRQWSVWRSTGLNVRRSRTKFPSSPGTRGVSLVGSHVLSSTPRVTVKTHRREPVSSQQMLSFLLLFLLSPPFQRVAINSCPSVCAVGVGFRTLWGYEIPRLLEPVMCVKWQRALHIGGSVSGSGGLTNGMALLA